MPQTKRVCDANAIGEGQLSRFELENYDILLTRYDGRVLALEDRCGHMAAPMSLGKLEGCTLTCPLHEAAFDAVTGSVVRGVNLPPPPPGQEANPRRRMVTLPRTYPLKVFQAYERDGGVFVDLPD